jgi:hypothetical protein
MNYRLLVGLALNMVAATCFAAGTEWRRYQIPGTGANVDIPVSIFTEDASSPDGGIGRRFFTKTTGQISQSSQFQIRRTTRQLKFCKRGDLHMAFNTSE